MVLNVLQCSGVSGFSSVHYCIILSFSEHRDVYGLVYFSVVCFVLFSSLGSQGSHQMCDIISMIMFTSIYTQKEEDW